MDPKLKETIVKQLGLENLSPDKQNEAIERIGKIIFQGTLMKILQTMNAEDQKELEQKLGAAKSEEDIMSFLKEKVPNLEMLVQEEAKRFKEEMSHMEPSK